MKAHWQQMREEVTRKFPDEACGLVASLDGISQAVYPVENALKSPVRFRMEPHQQVQAMLSIEEQGWEMSAIFHSHPAGPIIPSPTDIAEAAYPGVVHLIWTIQDGAWICRAFLIDHGTIVEIPLVVGSVE